MRIRTLFTQCKLLSEILGWLLSTIWNWRFQTRKLKQIWKFFTAIFICRKILVLHFWHATLQSFKNVIKIFVTILRNPKSLWIKNINDKNCEKSVQIRSFIWSVFSCIRTKYNKIRTRKISVFGQFSRTVNIRNTPDNYPGKFVYFFVYFFSIFLFMFSFVLSDFIKCQLRFLCSKNFWEMTKSP